MPELPEVYRTPLNPLPPSLYAAPPDNPPAPPVPPAAPPSLFVAPPSGPPEPPAPPATWDPRKPGNSGPLHAPKIIPRFRRAGEPRRNNQS
jgi:hypothetical protein